MKKKLVMLFGMVLLALVHINAENHIYQCDQRYEI